MFPVLPALQHRQDNLFLAGYSVSVPIELRRIAQLTSVEGCRTCCLCGGAVRIVGVGLLLLLCLLLFGLLLSLPCGFLGSGLLLCLLFRLLPSLFLGGFLLFLCFLSCFFLRFLLFFLRLSGRLFVGGLVVYSNHAVVR